MKRIDILCLQRLLSLQCVNFCSLHQEHTYKNPSSYEATVESDSATACLGRLTFSAIFVLYSATFLSNSAVILLLAIATDVSDSAGIVSK